MNIDFYSHCYFPAQGGAEYLIQSLAESLRNDYFHNCRIFTTNAYSCDAFNDPSLPVMNASRSTINSIEVSRFNLNDRNNAFSTTAGKFLNFFENAKLNEISRLLNLGPRSLELIKSALTENCDISVVTAFPLLHTYIFQLGKKLLDRKFILIGCFHIDDPLHRTKINLNTAFNSDGYICLTRVEYDYFIRRGVKKNNLLLAAPPVIDAEIIRASNESARAKIGLATNLNILYFGQIIYHKNLELLLKAFESIAREKSEIGLIIAGGGSSNYYKKLLNIVNCFDEWIKSRITIKTDIDESDKNIIYSAADIFILPSFYESFGIVILEAWQYGLPVIVSDIEQLKDLTESGKCGLIFNKYDCQDLKSKIQTLIDNSELRRELGEKGRELLKIKYNKRDLMKIINSFITSKAAS